MGTIWKKMRRAGNQEKNPVFSLEETTILKLNDPSLAQKQMAPEFLSV